MKAVLKLPGMNSMGNLIWMPPYLYPIEYLRKGVNMLTEKGYWISLFPEGDGIAFSNDAVPASEMYSDFCFAFRWIDIKLYPEEEEFDYENDILKFQLIILPVSRLEISEPIVTERLCLFPAGEFQIEKIDVRKLSGTPFQGGTSNKIRDHVTEITEVGIEVFKTLPVVVFTKEISFGFYHSLKQNEDDDLIKNFSQTADDLLDLIRFYQGDYNTPELMLLTTKEHSLNFKEKKIILMFFSYSLLKQFESVFCLANFTQQLKGFSCQVCVVSNQKPGSMSPALDPPFSGM